MALLLAAIVFTSAILGWHQTAFAASSQYEVPKPPLTMRLDNGGNTATITWQPRDQIEAYPHYNVPTIFFINFTDGNGAPLANTKYSVIVKDTDLTVIKELKNGTTDDLGRAAPLSAQFQQRGVGYITTCIFVDNASKLDTCGDFGIMIVPEFPATLIPLVAGMVLGTMIFIQKVKNPNTYI